MRPSISASKALFQSGCFDQKITCLSVSGSAESSFAIPCGNVSAACIAMRPPVRKLFDTTISRFTPPCLRMPHKQDPIAKQLGKCPLLIISFGHSSLDCFQPGNHTISEVPLAPLSWRCLLIAFFRWLWHLRCFLLFRLSGRRHHRPAHYRPLRPLLPKVHHHLPELDA